jgi:hypothetical protein
MKRFHLIRFLVVCLCSGLVASCGGHTSEGMHEIEYRGTTFKVTKTYFSFEDYKDDPNNIDLSEVPRIEHMMTEVKIGPEFSNWKDFVHQAFTVIFPGYGFGPGPAVKSTSRRFGVSMLEIPRASKERWLVLEQVDGERLRLVDDFVFGAPDEREPGTVTVEFIGGELVYSNAHGVVVRRTTVPPPAIRH